VRQVPANRIVIYGHSLGSGVATELALHVEAAGLILEGAFTSVPDRGAEIYPWLPVRLLATQRFANIDKIGHVAMPKLIMHASDDSIIPYAHGQRLFAAARAPKEWVELKGGHMRAFLEDSAHFWGHASAFVQRLRSDLPVSESPAPR
jgi:pimeloyl-ACP methyl ester carboxylesterase